jgi:hypothetical protein
MTTGFGIMKNILKDVRDELDIMRRKIVGHVILQEI